MRRAIFLDRDGTLNKDLGYVHKPEDWHWLPDVPDCLARLKKAGWLLVVVSNQSGIGRGFFDIKAVDDLEKHVQMDLGKKNITIDGWYYCPHLPDAGCDCRKPLPGLIYKAARELDIALGKSWMLGDRLRDVLAGMKAGCKTGLLFNPEHEDEWLKCRTVCPGTHLWQDFSSAASYILHQKSG